CCSRRTAGWGACLRMPSLWRPSRVSSGAELNLRPAAVHHQIGARDIAAFSGCEEECGGGQFVDVPHTSQRNDSGEHLPGTVCLLAGFELPIDDGCLGGTRAQAIDANPSV